MRAVVVPDVNLRNMTIASIDSTSSTDQFDNSIHQGTSELLDISFICNPYEREQGGYPLIAKSLRTDIEKITISSLEKLGLTFHRAWDKFQYKELEEVLNLDSLRRLLGVSQMQVLYTSLGHNHTNNRYVHSLFVAQQVYEVIQAININADNNTNLTKIDEQDTQDCIIAGLFHDHEHGPFSHIFERVYHAFGSNSFNHDEALRESLINNRRALNKLRKIKCDAEKIIDILDHKSSKFDHFHQLVKVFSDRFAYILADAFSSDFSKTASINELELAKEKHSNLLYLIDRVKKSVCVVESNSKLNLSFINYENNNNGETYNLTGDLEELFEYRKQFYKLYSLSPEAHLVGAIVGKAIKLLSTQHPNRDQLAKELSKMTDADFITRLATEDYCYPELKEMFLNAKHANVDQNFTCVLSYTFADQRFNDRQTNSTFRKRLREHLRNKFQLADNEVYITFPIDHCNFRTSFSMYNSTNGSITMEEINRSIKDDEKSFGIWIANKNVFSNHKERILNSELQRMTQIKESVENFVRQY